MNHEAMQNLLRARPFRPFELITSAGEVHQVPHPEFTALTKSRIVIVSPDSEDMSIVPLLHITEARFILTAEA